MERDPEQVAYLTHAQGYLASIIIHFHICTILEIPYMDIKKKGYNFTCTNADKHGRVPDFVFLAHIVDVSAALHAPFVFRSFASLPFSTKIFLLPIWPPTLLVLLVMWAWSKIFLYSFYELRGRLHQTWVVPRFGFQVWLHLFIFFGFFFWSLPLLKLLKNVN